MGFALPGDRMHAPNERFFLPNFLQGIEAAIWFLAEVGRWPKAPARRKRMAAGHGAAP